MTKSSLIKLLLVVFVLTLLSAAAIGCGRNLLGVPNDHYVAHAGGAYQGLDYTDTLNALNQSYAKGFKYFEIDFDWTTDGFLVCLHDISRFNELTGGKKEAYSLAEFNQSVMLYGLQQMDLPAVMKWVKEHKEIYLITDIKSENVKALGFIKKNYPEEAKRIIPQVYYFEEYEPVKDQEYKKIMLTLYRANYSDEEVLNFAQSHRFSILSIPAERALNSDLANKLKKLGIITGAHTVNQKDEAEALKKKGVSIICTDSLDPKQPY